ncbi:MAG: ABC transporter permease subunit [Gammaproteobacteria bacterium]|nr:ABC transporter permease subunit [Gammaproteobacteria bacterium]
MKRRWPALALLCLVGASTMIDLASAAFAPVATATAANTAASTAKTTAIATSAANTTGAPKPFAEAISGNAHNPLQIGSKAFSESYLLAEIVAQLLQSRGFAVERKLGLGGTLIAFEAIRNGTIDIYPEYTGTLTQAVLQQPTLDFAQLASALQTYELAMPVALGFSNSYAMAINADLAQQLAMSKISELAAHPELQFGFSHEFLQRGDGWPALSRTYGLPHQPVGLEHALAYAAIEQRKLDVTDAYTTDGELSVRNITLLADDLGFFPGYDAVLLARRDVPDAAIAVLRQLQQRISEERMRELNYRVAQHGLSPAQAAAQFLQEEGFVGTASVSARSRWQRIGDYTLAHLQLTATALLLACVVAVPLALALFRFTHAAGVLLYFTGLIQTIPALALLALLIPWVGLGQFPAIIALFLYSLLPIVRNTLTGLLGVDPLLKQVAAGMGMNATQQLLRVELPLALPTLLAGVKTAAIISIGTATLAAFVGAGGLGEPIITGLTLNDHTLILEGAIPAAMLAIGVELLFSAVEKHWVPAHLRH